MIVTLQTGYKSVTKCLSLTTLIISCSILKAGAQTAPYSIGFIPASIEETDLAFPIYKKWHLSGQTDLQMVTQGAYTNSNPFAYVQRFVVRPWLVYSGLKHMTLWLGYTHNHKYEIKEAGNADILERRLTVMGNFAQNTPKLGMFEQVRFETKFFKDRNGIQRTIPRIRLRIGANHFLTQKASKPWFSTPAITYYTELMLKFASKDYAPNRFDIFRQSAFYSAGITRNIHFAAGVIGQIQLRNNGTQFDLYYGPILSFKYSFNPKPHAEFENMDAGAD